VINDVDGVTIASASSLKLNAEGTKKEIAALVGTEVAKAAQAAVVSTVVFDRNGYLYHGRVKELADAARAAGLNLLYCLSQCQIIAQRQTEIPSRRISS